MHSLQEARILLFGEDRMWRSKICEFTLNRSAGQQRVVDTATYFLRGYLSQGNYLTSPTLNRGVVVSLPDSVNFTSADSLTPSTSCPNYPSGDTSTPSANGFRALFQPQIAERLNKFLNGLTLNATDIGPMQDLCGFSDEINGDTRFCDIFTGLSSFRCISPSHIFGRF